MGNGEWGIIYSQQLPITNYQLPITSQQSTVNSQQLASVTFFEALQSLHKFFISFFYSPK
jgi:hypothetical protein